MNIYALNETPINGWVTHYGQGTVGSSLAVTGKSARAIKGSASCTLTLSTSGSGVRRAPGYGSVPLAAFASGSGLRLAKATASPDLELDVSGKFAQTALGASFSQAQLTVPDVRGGIVVSAESLARLELELEGTYRVIEPHRPSAITQFRLNTSGDGVRLAMGRGLASLSIKSTANGTRRVPARSTAQAMLEVGGNGTRRVPATGEADISIFAAGDGYRRTFATADVALSLTTGGNGIRRAPGFGYALMRAFARGDYRTTTPHLGSAHALLWVNPFGDGRLTAFNQATAALQLRVAGEERATRKMFGQGHVTMRMTFLRAVANHHREITGEGLAQMTLTARAQDNRIGVLPSQYASAPTARQIRVTHERRAMRVPQPSREAHALEAAC